MLDETQLSKGGTSKEDATVTMKTRQRDLHSAAIRRIALFVDGMSRAAVLSFGPALVGRLLSDDTSASAAADHIPWPNVTYPTAVLVGGYIVGRALGKSITSRSALVRSHLSSGGFSIAAGASVALHVFTFGRGATSLRFLVCVRFVSAVVSGALCEVAAWKTTVRATSQPERNGDEEDFRLGSASDGVTDLTSLFFAENSKSNTGSANIARAAAAARDFPSCLDVKSGASKIYLCGFAVSILSGGLLFYTLAKSSVFRALTGGYAFTLSPILFVAIALATAFVLDRCFIPSCPDEEGGEHGVRRTHTSTHSVGGSVEGAVKRITRGIVNGVAQRRRCRRRQSAEDAYDEELLRPMVANNSRGFAQDSRGFADADEEEQMEFFDSLSLSGHFHTTPNRRRASSARSERSEDLFFDCESQLDEDEFEEVRLSREVSGEQQPVSAGTTVAAVSDSVNRDHELAQYVEGKCVYVDGTPAYVPHGECSASPPQSYLTFHKGNDEKACSMWDATKSWRLERNVWNIHTLPHPYFPKIKDAYPHFVHGFTKRGYPVIYEQPGKMNLKSLFRSGCEISEMVRHYTFFMEFLSHCVCSRTDVRENIERMDAGSTGSGGLPFGFVVVMDVKGASVSHLSGDVLKYLKQAGDINSAHYPLSMQRALVVNCPFLLAAAWSGVKGVLPESVQVDILGSRNCTNGLREHIDDDQIPPEYGGSSPYGLGSHPLELELCDLVNRADSGGGDAAASDGAETAYNLSGLETICVDDGASPPFVSGRGGEDHSDRDFGVGDAAEDGVSVPRSGSRRTDLATPSSAPNVPGFPHTRRRLGSGVMRGSMTRTLPLHVEVDEECSEENGILSQDPIKNASSAVAATHDGDILAIVSVLYTVWCAVQGAVETAVPLWIMSPPLLGGLGYEPPRAGVTIFCASIVLMWLARCNVASVVSRIPDKSPMRAFRVGVGAEAVLLIILPLVPSFVTSVSKKDSVLVMTSTIIVLSSMVLFNLLGHSGAALLHRIAASSYSDHPERRAHGSSMIHRLYGEKNLRSDCRNGRLTAILNIVGEVLGAFAVAPLFSWSTSQQRPSPFDGACCFYMAGLVCFVLYVVSFSLHLDLVLGRFSPHPTTTDSAKSSGASLCNHSAASRCAFAGEVIAVSVSDMASLFEEANWSSSSVLGFTKDKGKGTGEGKLSSSPSAYGSLPCKSA